MKRAELIQHIRQKQSFLCVGLDPDPERIPEHLKSSPDSLFEFCRAIIDATADYCVAYKPNLAFFEQWGAKGWQTLERVLAYIPDTHFTIADAKRGDIGNTSRRYARTFFSTYSFDALTVAPYMGEDSVTPFLEGHQGWVIVLGLTSNPGSQDFQQLQLKDGRFLWESVLEKVSQWAAPDRLMFVVGATQPEAFRRVREIVPNHFLLVPGVGAQGGSLEEVAKYGMNEEVGLLVNSSRGILYAGQGPGFAESSRKAAHSLAQKMAPLVQKVL